MNAHFGQMKFSEVPVIIDFAEEESIRHAHDMKASGIPFVVRGHRGWAKFAYKVNCHVCM